MNDILPSTTPAATRDEQCTVTEAVVDAVATAHGVSPLDLEPIGRVIDPDALEALVDSMARGATPSTGRVEFDYCGYDVTVGADGDVTVSE